MKCPHCLVSIHPGLSLTVVTKDSAGEWGVLDQTCPECKKAIIYLVRGSFPRSPSTGAYLTKDHEKFLVRPRGASRTPMPPEVPLGLGDDYREACLVLPDSAKASAALSRRCLQHLLREKAGIRKRDLADEIQEVLDKRMLPSYLADSLDAVRVVGNFAAHPIKSKTTGEIVPVEPGEAEWNLDVLEGLFDFFFVQPEILKKKRDVLNKKLGEAGKPPLK